MSDEWITVTPAHWAYGLPPGRYELRPEIETMFTETSAAITRIHAEMFGEDADA